jgi:hypothetical protein
LPPQTDPKEKVHTIFHGISMGTKVAEAASAYLSPFLHTLTTEQGEAANLHLLLDNPVTHHKTALGGIGIPVGFLAEGGIRGLFDENMKQSIAAEKESFLPTYRAVLAEKDIDAHEDKESLDLKAKAWHADVLHMIKGSPLDTENVHMLIRQGLKDPTTFSPVRLIQTLIQIKQGKNAVQGEGNALTFAINSTHFIDRFRVERWADAIEYCNNYKINPRWREEQWPESTKVADRIVAWGNSVLGGEHSGHLDEYAQAGEMVPVEGSEGQSEVEDGVILDFNDTRISPVGKEKVKAWIEEKLGSPLDVAPLQAIFTSEDGETTFQVYDKQFGEEDDPWRFSKWQNQGQEPSYILWSQEMYDQQEELGYTKGEIIEHE